MSAHTVRIVTYNIHKCRGVDRRTDPLRIATVLRQLEPDIAALQEVIDMNGGKPEHDQARVIAAQFENYESHFGSNRQHFGAAYGNMTLSRFPVRFWRNYDLTWRNRERRGCLRTDVELANGRVLHIFNVHLGTGFLERRQQGRKLVSTEVLGDAALSGLCVVVGDFNEWTRGLATKLMSGKFESVDIKAYARFGRTYPGVLPIFHLDHFYYDRRLVLSNYKVHRTRAALLGSDHLPLMAEFELAQ
jgi:endonuclease/exonuclease/phosphatase family metal-dependent hydrolase